MDIKLVKNNSVRNGDSNLQKSDNYNPKQVDICNINQAIITSHTATVTPQNMLRGIYSTQNFSYQTILIGKRSSPINHGMNYAPDNQLLKKFTS
jgi:hypothetical protein